MGYTTHFRFGSRAFSRIYYCCCLFPKCPNSSAALVTAINYFLRVNNILGYCTQQRKSLLCVKTACKQRVCTCLLSSRESINCGYALKHRKKLTCFFQSKQSKQPATMSSENFATMLCTSFPFLKKNVCFLKLLYHTSMVLLVKLWQIFFIRGF